MYVTNSKMVGIALQYSFAKVDCANMSYTNMPVTALLDENGEILDWSFALNGFTDDMVCKVIDDNGSICYLGTEVMSYPSATGLVIDTAAMSVVPDRPLWADDLGYDEGPILGYYLPGTVAPFSTGGATSYGMFISGNDLYNVGIGKIIRYKNFDLEHPEVWNVSGSPNEFFVTSSGKVFITYWSASSKLVEIKFPNL